MRTNSRQEFFLKREEVSLPLTDSMVTQIDAIRRKMFQELGFQKNHVGQFGFGDVEGFIRFGDRWDYILKCRSIEAGVRLGALLPSGEWRDENEPASIPLGGNGHYGWYLDADGLFELKEDIKVGVLFQLNKRLPRTRLLRLPIDLEPRIFGVLQERVRVNPGVTLIFSPYFVLENLQKGLGVSVQYSLIKHQEDSWRIVQPNGRGRVKEIIELSEWGQDYFTINIFYDFGKMKKERSFDPILSFKWDIPSMLFMSKNMVRTHKVALGLEFAF